MNSVPDFIGDTLVAVLLFSAEPRRSARNWQLATAAKPQPLGLELLRQWFQGRLPSSATAPKPQYLRVALLRHSQAPPSSTNFSLWKWGSEGARKSPHRPNPTRTGTSAPATGCTSLHGFWIGSTLPGIAGTGFLRIRRNRSCRRSMYR